MCLYPKVIKNRKYTSTKKNKGIIPQVKDKRVLYVPVACGNCMECRTQKARQWQVRLSEEIRHDSSGKFVTLTFNDDSLEELGKEIKGLSGYDLDNEIATKAVRRYFERWRKKYKKSCKHWLVTELGQTSTERIHLHGIMWTNEIEDISLIWKYGHVTIGKQKWDNGVMVYDGENYVNERTINYIVKYINKADKLHKEYKSKILTSAGIGKGYLNRLDSKNNRYQSEGTTETYKTRTGAKLNLPIYYRNHIYNEEQREELWLEKLDKQERWVDGKRISIANGEEEYWAALKVAREKNKRLGYGDNSINWDRKRYENERRNLIKRGKIWESGKEICVTTQDAIGKKQAKELVSIEKLGDVFGEVEKKS